MTRSGGGFRYAVLCVGARLACNVLGPGRTDGVWLRDRRGDHGATGKPPLHGTTAARASGRSCRHLDQIRDVRPGSTGCQPRLALGDSWVHLRMCMTDGVLCCDSSKNKHASGHAENMHPCIRSSGRLSLARIGSGATRIRRWWHPPGPACCQLADSVPPRNRPASQPRHVVAARYLSLFCGLGA
jgi:hypothetical protein